LGLGEPFWVDDERFDIGYHVNRLGRSGMIGRARLQELTDAVLSEPLDRERPLWRVYLAPSLEDGTAAMVCKIHHALVDGMSAVEVALLLFDAAPDAQPPAAEDWLPAQPPSRARLVLETVTEGTGESLRAVRGAARLAGSPGRNGVRIADTLRRTALSVGDDLLKPAPRSYLNVPIGPERTLLGHRTPIDRLLELRAFYGVTLNDICLAVVAGAMRQLALARKETPRPLRVMVPISVRADEQRADLGNRISFAFIDLPIHLSGPARRVRAVHEATAAFKRANRARANEVIMGALGALPGPMKGRAARFAGSARVYNLTVSNVPGPRFPVYMLGAEMEEAYPVVPIAEDHALSIGIFSYREHVHFGLYADPAALPQVNELPAALATAILALGKTSRRWERSAAGEITHMVRGRPRARGHDSERIR
jgi:WS/DGAT/MGAT family acyltransferase